MIIQRLDTSHAGAYRSLMLDAYALHPEAFTSSVEERAALPMAWWLNRLDAAPGAVEQVWGALDADQLVGVAGVSVGTREKLRHKACLFGMYVRSQGVGRMLVQAVLAEARVRKGIKLVQLTVSESNEAALRLYRSQGFRVFGVEPKAVAIGSTFVDKVHMWRDLDGLIEPLMSETAGVSERYRENRHDMAPQRTQTNQPR